MSPRRAGAWALLAALVALGALLDAYARGWASDNRVQTWTRAGEADPGYELLQARFGGDEIVLLRADRFAPDDARARAWLLALGARLQALPAVRRVADPLHVPGVRAPAPGGELDAAAAEPLVRALDLVEPRAPRVDFVLSVDAAGDQAARTGLAGALEGLEEDARAHGVRLRCAGHPLVAAELDREGRRVQEVFAPLLGAAAFVAVAVALRSLVLAGLAVLCAALASLGVRAGLRAVGWDSNLILVSAGPLIFVIVLASVLHLVAAWQRHRHAGLDAPAAARAALRSVAAGSVLAALTTSVGFGVFLFSPIEAVWRLGAAMSLAVALFVALAFAALSVLLAGLPLRVPRRLAGTAQRWRRLAFVAVRWRAALALASVLVVAAGATAAVRLERSTDGLAYFPDGHRVKEAFLAIEREGGAPTTLDVLLAFDAPLPAARLAPLARADLGARFRALPGCLGVFGPEDVLAQVSASGGALGVLALPTALRAADRADLDLTALRWTVRIPREDAQGIARSAERARAAAEAWVRAQPGLDAHVAVTGTMVRIQHMQTALTTTLVSSIGLSIAVTILLFLVTVRSLHELAAALLVNLLPVGAALAAAWGLGLQLDAATVMVSSVVLGLAVDNTFHLLHAAGRGRARSELRAVARAIERVGPPAATASVALALGFGVLTLSGFRPTARFGGLVAVGMCASLAGSLCVLPAVWARVRRAAAAPGPRTRP